MVGDGMDLEHKFTEISNRNAGRAMEAMEIAGITNPALKSRIKNLIHFTYKDTIKAIEAFLKEETA